MIKRSIYVLAMIYASLLHSSFFSKEGFFSSISGSHQNSGQAPSNEEIKQPCFCAWFSCCSQPSSCCPTRDDCRSYKLCKPCVSAESRINFKCGDSCACFFCPCVLQHSVMK